MNGGIPLLSLHAFKIPVRCIWLAALSMGQFCQSVDLTIHLCLVQKLHIYLAVIYSSMYCSCHAYKYTEELLIRALLIARLSKQYTILKGCVFEGSYIILCVRACVYTGIPKLLRDYYISVIWP
jgi:hypothetical protein